MTNTTTKYKIIESATEDFPINITVMDETGEVASAYCFSENTSDIVVACIHPEVDFAEDDERGICPVCGAECDWSWDGLDDEGHKERYITDWHEEPSPSPDSILGKAIYNA